MEPTLDLRDLPLVGREEAQEGLLRGLEEAGRGAGRTVLLRGERGAGKTRLALALREEAERRGFLLACGRAYRAETGVPYALVSDAFLPLLQGQTSHSLDVLTRGAAGELGHLFPGLATTGSPPAGVGSESPGEQKTRVLWTFTQLLKELSRRTPLLIVLEDLQWADPSSVELIHFLARQLSGAAALLLLTLEETPENRDPILGEMERSLLEQGIAEGISLPPLSREGTGHLLKAAFGVEEGAVGEFADLLHGWTRGNPFFLGETLQVLVRSGQLYRKGGMWLGWEIREMALPRTVREALLSRLDLLPKETRALAELAAVLGGRAPFHLLQAASRLPDPELMEALEILMSRGILLEGLEGSAVVYDFRQPLLRETLLAELGLARARLLHGRVARTLEDHYGDRARAHADVLAYHHLEAGEEGLGPRGTLYLVLAGRDALERGGNPEAARYLRGALDLLQDDASRGTAPSDLEAGRPGIVRDLARALTRMGRYGDAIPLWEEASRLAEERGDQEEAAECRRRIGIILSYQGDPAGALKEADGILSRAPLGLSPLLLARARLRRGLALEELGRPEEAGQELEAVLETARHLRDPMILAQAHRALVLLHTWTGRPDRVRDHARQAMDLATESGARSVVFWTHWGVAVLEGLLGNTELMAQRVREAEQVALELGSPLLSLRSAELAIEQAAATGEWDTGLAVGEQAIALARSLSQNTILPRLLVWTSLIYLGRGEVALARPLLSEAWTVAGAGEGRTPNIHGLIPAYTGLGYLALAEGRLDEAIRLGTEGLRLADRVGYSILAVHRLLPLLAEAFLWKGELAGAQSIGERLRKDSSAIGHKLGLAWAQTCEALVTWLGGDPGKGAKQMEEAARALEEVPMIPDATRLRRQLAGRLAEMGDREGALRELTRVHETFLKLGAEVELEKTRGMFREMEARPPRRSPPGEGALSAREVEIAGMVEKRMSNKAIAKELEISARTVSTHLSNIYRKLGVGSRGELADCVRVKGVRAE